MNTNTTGSFSYYVEPETIETESDTRIHVGAGSVDGDAPGQSIIEVLIGDAECRLSPADAALLGEALTRHSHIDDGLGSQYAPRTGQTFPASTPLDTLKHLALRVQELCRSAQGAVEAMELDDEDGPGAWLDVAIDDIVRETKLALGEHIEGINPDAISTDIFSGEGYTIPGWAPGPLWAAEVNRYDSGAPIRLHVEDGDAAHTVWTRLSPDARTAARTAS